MKVQLAIIIMFIFMSSTIRIQEKARTRFGILVIVMSALFVDLQLKNLQSQLRMIGKLKMNLRKDMQSMKKKTKSIFMQ